MKLFAWIYSLAVCGSLLWSAVGHIISTQTGREQLLPQFLFYFLSLPSSLLIDYINDTIPWILDIPYATPVVMICIAGIQIAVVWLIAIRFGARGQR
jgi:hypothetical protein